MGERTPGPWQVSPNDAATVTDSKSEFVAYVAVKADARFIAAAPDMEKALETAAYVLEHYLDYTQNDMAVMAEDARAAIAKAKGETPTMPEPTKGPWRASWSRESQSWLILNEDGRMIATAFESETNARRIAAIPVMEKALERVMRMCFENLSGEESGAILEVALAAIAKARGE